MVYGGGSLGLMGAVAESAYNNKGKVIGVIPEIFNRDSVLKKTIHSSLIVTTGMHERKAKIYCLSDAFIALPGGIGTLEEFMEIFTWRQIGYHNKNIALLNVNEFYAPLVNYLEFIAKQGFLSEKVLSSLIVESDIDALLSRLETEEIALPDKIEEYEKTIK